MRSFIAPAVLLLLIPAISAVALPKGLSPRDPYGPAPAPAPAPWGNSPSPAPSPPANGPPAAPGTAPPPGAGGSTTTVNNLPPCDGTQTVPASGSLIGVAVPIQCLSVLDGSANGLAQNALQNAPVLDDVLNSLGVLKREPKAKEFTA